MSAFGWDIAVSGGGEVFLAALSLSRQLSARASIHVLSLLFNEDPPPPFSIAASCLAESSARRGIRVSRASTQQPGISMASNTITLPSMIRPADLSGEEKERGDGSQTVWIGDLPHLANRTPRFQSLPSHHTSSHPRTAAASVSGLSPPLLSLSLSLRALPPFLSQCLACP
ncbi:hypothetical protein LY76DRAFT_14201 [Colletotrichum caudatum]|nr:hypothetical protein LY76DRAFT_14201 [Colletotrichum caudatum]